MSTSLLYHVFGINSVDYTKTEYLEGKVFFYGEVNDRLFRCSNCISRKVIKFGHKIRKIKLVPIGGKQAFLMLTNYRLKCKKCGHKVEGINNKIKTLKRQAYGFRDLVYFKLRLYHLHKQNYLLYG